MTLRIQNVNEIHNVFFYSLNLQEIRLITHYYLNEEFYWSFYTTKIIHLDKSYQLYSEPNDECPIKNMFIKDIISVKSFYHDNSQKWLQLVQNNWIKI